MKLLILLICLGIQRYLNFTFSLEQLDWFTPYQKMIKKLVPAKLMQGYIGILILVLPVAVLVTLIGAIFHITWLTSLIFGSVVLFFCLDARELGLHLGLNSSGDAAKDAMSDARARDVLGESIPRDPAAKARSMTRAIFIHSLHHIFSVIFWYAIFGVFGAVTFFLIQHIASSAKKEESGLSKFEANAKTLLAGFEWVPVRLLGLSLAAVGSGGKVIKQVTNNLVGGLGDQGQLASLFGLSAIKADADKPETASDKETKDALNLVFMSTGVWLAVILIFTVISLV